MSKNKIIFFLSNLDSGGLETYLLRFLSEYNKYFENIIIYCKNGKYGTLYDKYNKLDNIFFIKKNIITINILHYISLTLWLRNKNDYIVCDFTGNFSGPVITAAKLAGISRRITFYRSSSNRFQNKFIKSIINNICHKLVRKYSTHIFANSKFAFKFFFNNVIDNRFKIIYNGINIQEFITPDGNLRNQLGIDDNTIVIGHTGRYNEAKNHRTIIQIAKQLLKKRNDVVFILCGKGVKSNLTSIVEEISLENHIILLNNRDDISIVLNTIDIFIFPSLTEGQPNSLIEAWIKGIPFVASNIPVIKQILPNKFHKYLKNPIDTDGFIELINKIIDGEFTNQEKLELRNWSRSTFNSHDRFKELYLALIN